MVQFPQIQSTIEMLLNVMLLCAVVRTDVQSELVNPAALVSLKNAGLKRVLD